jgi:peroxiredoxin
LRELQESYEKIKENNTIILSVSAISEATAQRLVEIFELDYPVLSDVDTQTIQQYGILNAAGNNAIISIFIVDTQGIISWKKLVEDEVAPGEQIIQELQKINQE